MKTDLNGLMGELSRLTQSNYLKSLKKELNRIAKDMKKLDVHFHFPEHSKARLEQLESRFHELLKALRDVQKQVDRNVEKFIKKMRGQNKTSSRTARSAPKAKTTKANTTPKTASASKKTAPRKKTAARKK